ncbi:MAG: hypothetical protein KatS3mg068_1773 [Candidatus Sericytochromatia bacterium]|nr:MAG: hypothetical protein KatS3mg068_1773 [Candidatus Sericytochromatia bacterium]
MLKKNILLSLFLSFCFLKSADAQDLIKLLIEKKINVDLKSGYILASSIKNLNTNFFRKTYFLDSLKNNSTYTENRKYKILNDENSFNSIISVISANGQEINRISVGRGATKLVLNPINKNIFVLCTGYFGSVWEIDTKRDLVIRKYTTYTNPSDISIDASGKFFYVSSSKLQKFVIGSNIIFDIDLPNKVKYIYSIAKSGDNLVSFSTFNNDKSIKSFTINTESKKIMEENSNIPFLESREIQISNIIPSKIQNDDLALVYSKNNDYLYIFSLSLGNIIGIIPLDYKIDDLVLVQNKALVLHRYINQISVIDLDNNSKTKFSVIARIVDDRLNDPTNKMVVEGTKVFIKSDNEQEGYIDENNILRYTMPIVEVPFNKDKDIFVVSKIANKRYFIKNNQLFYEDLLEYSTNFSKKIKLDIFGNTISGLAINDDGKILYFSDYENNIVFAMDTLNNSIINKITVGNKPAELIFYNTYLFILNKDDYTISVIDLKQNKVVNNIKLKVESSNLNVIKIYDKDFKQIIRVSISPQTNKEISMVKLF